jgi:hypothetical protein
MFARLLVRQMCYRNQNTLSNESILSVRKESEYGFISAIACIAAVPLNEAPACFVRVTLLQVDLVSALYFVAPVF